MAQSAKNIQPFWEDPSVDSPDWDAWISLLPWVLYDKRGISLDECVQECYQGTTLKSGIIKETSEGSTVEKKSQKESKTLVMLSLGTEGRRKLSEANPHVFIRDKNVQELLQLCETAFKTKKSRIRCRWELSL